MTKKEWDVFISHASEDKQRVVKPIARYLSGLGARVWYDEFTLELGDSLSRSIDRGLSNSRFGLVVLSPAFFSKSWPEYELRGLVARELGRDKVILPIWHDLDRDDVLAQSPPLADKLALRTQDHSIEKLALAVLGVVRPDLLDDIHKRLAFEAAVKRGTTASVDPKTIKVAPIRHKALPDELVRRIRLVRAALMVPYPQTMEFWLDGFKRDMHPHAEVAFWERVAACYLENATANELTADQHRLAFSYIFASLSGVGETALRKYEGGLPKNTLAPLARTCRSTLPFYELVGFPNSITEKRGKKKQTRRNGPHKRSPK